MAALALAQLSHAQGVAGLTDSERQQLDGGELVVRTQDLKDFPWPEVRVYRRVDASPEEVMAIYADFEDQARYLPRLLQSRIVERVSANSFRVFYEYDVRGPNEEYTMQSVVTRVPGGYRLKWDMLEGRYTRRLSGWMTVEAFGSEAVIEYVNRVDPGFFGGLLGSPETAVQRLRETVQALVSHVERFRVDHREELGTLIRTLRAMLGGL